VINIIPPRDVWGPIQSLRTAFIPDARCGPHFSFLDPFVTLKHFPDAAKLLTEELSTFKPFKVYLNKLNYFIHSQTISLFLEPITEPPNAIEDLLERCLKIFPQCNDTVLRSKTGKYQPHMTIAKFTSEEQLHTEMAKLRENWNPISFEVKELYFLHRYEGNPFEVRHVIPLGPDITPPFFGPGSPGSPGSTESEDNYDANILQLSRTCLICSLPPGINEALLKDNFAGFSIRGSEILKNPDGKDRSCGVIEFYSKEDALKACNEFTGNLSMFYRVTQVSGSYIIHLPNAVFPCYGIGDCCSLNSIIDSS
jgi:2'-5' RNA ligase